MHRLVGDEDSKHWALSQDEMFALHLTVLFQQEHHSISQEQ
jgi:hypothetical protein